MASYLSDKIQVQTIAGKGRGLVATERIEANELVLDYATHATAVFLSMREIVALRGRGWDYDLQVDDDLYLAVREDGVVEPADLINHSCEPNAGIGGRLRVIAMRPIEPGEEVCFDYAMVESGPYVIGCECGAARCRGTITGEDWKMADLQTRYELFFSEYLARRIFLSRHDDKAA